jgi:hypothetical protein
LTAAANLKEFRRSKRKIQKIQQESKKYLGLEERAGIRIGAARISQGAISKSPQEKVDLGQEQPLNHETRWMRN